MTSCRPFRRTSFPSLDDTTQALVFRPHAAECCRARVSWSWSPGISSRGFVSGNGRISYVPGEPRLCSCPALRPRQDRRIRPVVMRRRGPRSVHDEGSRIGAFEAQSHGFGTGCGHRAQHGRLRRPGYPDTTQDSLPAAGQALPGGLGYPQGSNERFRVVSYISASFPKFNVAQGQVQLLPRLSSR
jgi:hypothetical protein